VVLDDEAPPPSPPKVVKIRSTTSDNVTLFKLDNGKAMFFTADLSVDADGCPRAYSQDNKGIEDIGNATSKTTGKLSPDVIVLKKNGTPFIQTATDPAPGFLISQTALRDNTKAASHPEDPTCYVDALTIPYIVIPGGATGGALPGHAALVISKSTGVRVMAIVGDVGGKNIAGEASMFCAGLVSGLTPSQITETLAKKSGSVINPRNGGPAGKFRYVVFTGSRLSWPATNEEIEAFVEGAMHGLTPAELLAVTT
ncbi:MAG: hypothetical protein ABUL72_06140, partial [Armatimonadota bacterium]